MNRLLASLLLTLVLALGVTAALLQFTMSEVAGPVEIESAEFIKSDDPVPPSPEAGWVLRQLPDDWSRSNPGQSGFGWYRATFDLAQLPSESWAVFLPTVASSHHLFVNGVDVGGASMTGPLERTLGRPLMDPIAPSVLRVGRNELLLRLRVARNLRGGLGPLTLGPHSVIEPVYDRDFLVRVTLPRALNMALVFVAVLVLLLWLRRPAETIYGVFAALALVWALRNFHYSTSLPVPSAVWEAFILASLGVVVVLHWIFMRRYTGAAPRRREAVLTAVAVASFPVFALLDAQVVRALRLPWYFLCALFGAWSIVLLVRYLRQPRARVQAGPWAILGGTTVTLLLGLTDLAVSAGWLPFGPAARMSYGAPLLLCSLVYAMAEEYFRTFEQARAQAAELERRVQERTAELERTHERLLALERVATVAAERERLMRDMHDGIGSQLITTLQTVERGGCGPEEVGELLRACMDDLRLMIDSLEPDEASLQMALANLAYRLEPRLRAAGVALKWDVEDCAPLPASGATLQVLRIVQEAVSNVLKHAGASMLRLATRREEGALVLQIADDGRGFAQCGAVGTAHRGLRNMRLRAQQLQAALDIESGVGGTRLTLRVPLG